MIIAASLAQFWMLTAMLTPFHDTNVHAVRTFESEAECIMVRDDPRTMGSLLNWLAENQPGRVISNPEIIRVPRAASGISSRTPFP